MLKRRGYFVLTLIILLFVSACSSTHEAYISSLKLAFSQRKDLSLSAEQIKQSPVDLIYVKRDELQTVILALAFIENGQYKWVSIDNAVLIEKSGRLTKTLSLDNNLDFISAESDDPLIHPAQISNQSTWRRKIDFDSSVYGVELSSKFNFIGPRSLAIQGKSIETVLIEETVDVMSDGVHEYKEMHWTNQFWLHQKTGQLLHSKQRILPDGQVFDITYISRAMRL